MENLNLPFSTPSSGPGAGQGWNVDDKGVLKYKDKEYQVKPLKTKDDNLSRSVSSQSTPADVKTFLMRKFTLQHSTGLEHPAIIELENGEKFKISPRKVTTPEIASQDIETLAMPLMEGITTNDERRHVLEAVSAIPEADRKNVTTLAAPLMKGITGDRGLILKALAEIPQVLRKSVINQTLDMIDIIFDAETRTQLLHAFLPGAETLCEKTEEYKKHLVASLMPGITVTNVDALGETISKIPKAERQNVITLATPLMKGMTDGYEKSRVLEAVVAIPQAERQSVAEQVALICNEFSIKERIELLQKTVVSVLKHTGTTIELLSKIIAQIKADRLVFHGGYSEKLLRSPPVPVEGINRLTEARTKVFIEAHPGDLQPAIKSMLDNTDYISFSEFSKQFDILIEHFNQEIKEKEEYIVLIEPEKSNKWLAELAFAKLKTPPKDIVRMDNLKEALNDEKNKGVKRIVLFDDASYSGEQMCKFIRDKAVTALSQANRKDFTINVAVPYMTQWASDKINDIKNDDGMKGKGTISISPHKIMRKAYEQIPEEYRETLTDNYYPRLKFQDWASLMPFFELKPDELLDTEKILKQYGFPEIDSFHRIIKRGGDILFDPANVGLNQLKRGAALYNDPEIRGKSADLVKALIKFWGTNGAQTYRDSAKASNEATEAKKKQDPHQDQYTARAKALGTFGSAMIGLNNAHNKQKFDKGFESRTLTIFDHKIADRLSIPEGFDSGTPIVKGEPLGSRAFLTGIPPYKSKQK